jgi:hypothetical protein
MFNIILLFIDFICFLLSIIFVILDIKSYEREKNKDFKSTAISKRSKYALLFGLLSLLVAVIVSIGYV